MRRVHDEHQGLPSAIQSNLAVRLAGQRHCHRKDRKLKFSAESRTPPAGGNVRLLKRLAGAQARKCLSGAFGTTASASALVGRELGLREFNTIGTP